MNILTLPLAVLHAVQNGIDQRNAFSNDRARWLNKRYAKYQNQPTLVPNQYDNRGMVEVTLDWLDEKFNEIHRRDQVRASVLNLNSPE